MPITYKHLSHCIWQEAEESKECIFEKEYYSPFINHHPSFRPTHPLSKFCDPHGKTTFLPNSAILKNMKLNLYVFSHAMENCLITFYPAEAEI